MEMIFNELTISTGMEGRAAEARHVLDSTNRRDDIVLEGERGRFSLDEGRDRITVQVIPTTFNILYPEKPANGAGLFRPLELPLHFLASGRSLCHYQYYDYHSCVSHPYCNQTNDVCNQVEAKLTLL